MQLYLILRQIIKILGFSQCLMGMVVTHLIQVGQQVAKFSQKHFVASLINNENFKKGSYEKALIETFFKIDELLLSKQGKQQLKLYKKDSNNQQSQAGCTANVCLITDKQLFVANAGDSRSIIVFKGKTQQMSIDHKPQNQIELKRIKNAGGTVSQGRINGNLNLSRALGDLQYKSNKNLKREDQMITAKPDVKKIPLTMVNFIVIGCDGIWQCKSNEEIGKYYEDGIKQKKKLKQLNENLLDKIINKDEGEQTGLDNMSLICVVLKKK